ncbi:MAG: PD-(D/E)XK nuclease family protein, partial [Bacteroidota bacterium]
ILHLSLENLYKDFLGKVLTENELKEKIKQIDGTVHNSFTSFFDNPEIVGKGILQEEVIKVYVEKLIKKDISFVKDLRTENHFLTLKNLEQEFSAPLVIEIKGAPTTIHIKGKIDRIDSHEGKTRIIDYKSSIKTSDKFIFTSFEDLFNDVEYNKQFQLFMYAWLVYKNNYCAPEHMQPCIIPFKNFLEKPKFISRDKQQLIFNADFLLDFENELRRYIESIFDFTKPFSQTEDKDTCEFCPYMVICNIPVK